MTHKLSITLIVLALALTSVVAIAYGIRLTENAVRDAYASDWTTEFVISHLQSSDNSWPSSWDDLENEHAARYPHPCPFTLSELRARVELNFSVDTTDISSASAPIVFFRLKSGSGANYGGDPNVRISDYLTSQSKQLDANTKQNER